MLGATRASKHVADQRARLTARQSRLMIIIGIFLAGLSLILFPGVNQKARAQATAPTMLDPNLTVSVVTAGFITPISMAFIGPDEILVLEKSTGKVQHVASGAVLNTALD